MCEMQSKSYMDVSMSAKRISSRARSVRKPEEEEAEAEGEVLMSRPLGGRVSISFESLAVMVADGRSRGSGFKPSSLGLQGLLQSSET